MSAGVMGGLAAAQTVIGGYQAYRQGKAQAEAYNANADILRRNARQVRLEGALNEDIQRAENRQQLSKTRALMGEMGIADSATAIGSLAQDAANAEQNALNIRYQTETAARNYMQQASDMNFYAKQAKKQGKNAFRMSLLSGAAKGIAAAYNASQPVDKEGQKKFSWLWGE